MTVTDAQFSGLSGDVVALEAAVLDNERLILGLPSKYDFNNAQEYNSEEFTEIKANAVILTNKTNTVIGYLQNLKSAYVNLSTLTYAHTGLSGVHIDWTAASAGNIDSSNYIDNGTEYIWDIKTGDYSVLYTDNIIYVSGDADITLPSASTVANRSFNIKNIWTGTVNLTGSDLIDGSLAKNLTQYDSFNVHSALSKWWIIS